MLHFINGVYFLIQLNLIAHRRNSQLLYHFLGPRKLLLSCRQTSTFEAFLSGQDSEVCSIGPQPQRRRSPVDVVLTSLAVVAGGAVVIVVNFLKFSSSLCLCIANVVVWLAELGSERLSPPHSTSQFRHIESRRVFVRLPPVWNWLTLRSATPSRSATPWRAPTPITTWWNKHLIHFQPL